MADVNVLETKDGVVVIQIPPQSPLRFSQLELDNGYKMQSTFWQDFSIADAFGINAIKDTFKRAFAEWKNNYVYLTELVLVLNHKIWQWYEKNEEVARVYNGLWEATDDYARENLKGEELSFFFETTD